MSRQTHPKRFISIVNLQLLDAVTDLCPRCFEREHWRDWVIDAVAAVTNDRDAQARYRAGKAPVPCFDCLPAHELRMRSCGRCEKEQLMGSKTKESA